MKKIQSPKALESFNCSGSIELMALRARAGIRETTELVSASISE